MSIAIDLTEPARDRRRLDPHGIVARPKTRKPAKDENEAAHSHESPATRTASETQMLSVQLACTLIMLAACTATLAFTASMIFDMAGSAIDKLLLLSPNQILQGMVGR